MLTLDNLWQNEVLSEIWLSVLWETGVRITLKLTFFLRLALFAIHRKKSDARFLSQSQCELRKQQINHAYCQQLLGNCSRYGKYTFWTKGVLYMGRDLKITASRGSIDGVCWVFLLELINGPFIEQEFLEKFNIKIPRTRKGHLRVVGLNHWIESGEISSRLGIH